MGYGRSSSPFDTYWSHIKRGGIPATYALVGINVVTFLFIWFGGAVIPHLIVTLGGYDSETVTRFPWILLSYALISDNFISLIFNGVALWLVGGSLERSWGTGKFLIVFTAFTLVSALSIFAGSEILHFESALDGPYYPLAALFMIFFLLNSEAAISVYGLFTVRGKYLAIATPVIVYFFSGFGPIGGLFSLGGCLAAFLYVRYGRTYSYLDYGYGGRPPAGPDLRIYSTTGKKRRVPTEYLDGSPEPGFLDVRGRIKAWQERKKLERLFRQSGLDVDEEHDFKDPGSDKKR